MKAGDNQIPLKPPPICHYIINVEKCQNKICLDFLIGYSLWDKECHKRLDENKGV